MELDAPGAIAWVVLLRGSDERPGLVRSRAAGALGILWLGSHIVAGANHLLVVVGVVLLIAGLVRRGARAIT
jgi:hypothetical protein